MLLKRLSEDDLWNYYNGLLLSHDVDRIRKLIVRYELFKLSLEIPGDIIECGVFKGAGLMYWTKLLDIFSSSSLKRVVGFDMFKEFSSNLEAYEQKTAQDYVKETQFEGVDTQTIYQRAEAAGLRKRVELVEGDITKTAADYTNNNPGFRISLLHMDLDTLQGTKSALEIFYPFVSRGGVIVFDEYACRGWGESDAVDAFFSSKSVIVKTVPHSIKPTAYAIKP